MPAAAAYDRLACELRKPLGAAVRGTLDLRECVRMAVLAASSHNTQPWRFRVGQGLQILPDRSRRCPTVDPDDAHLYKSLGCAAENAVQAAAHMGYDADCAYDAGADLLEFAFRRARGAPQRSLADAIPLRQCTRLAYDAQPVPPAVLAALDHAGQGAGVRTLLLTDRPRIDALIELVSEGNRQQLTDPAFRRELVQWIRFNPASALAARDGVAGRVSGQPALPDWLAPLLLDVALSAERQAATDARHLRSSAGVAITVGTTDAPDGWIECGRAWQRFALVAARCDLRTAFVNQPVEVPALRTRLGAWLGLTGEHPLLVTRFGYGPLAPYSLRRPLDEVLIGSDRRQDAAAARRRAAARNSATA